MRCFGRSCTATRSPKSPRRKSASPRKSPGRKHIGMTRWTSKPVFRQSNGKMTLGNNRTPVFRITNTANRSHNGLYTANDVDILEQQLRAPKWTF